jgi:hypothetical protein
VLRAPLKGTSEKRGHTMDLGVVWVLAVTGYCASHAATPYSIQAWHVHVLYSHVYEWLWVGLDW